MAHESPGQTLQATALVHEAYLRLTTGVAWSFWNVRRPRHLPPLFRQKFQSKSKMVVRGTKLQLC